jgi:hypothetical protein
MAVYGLFGLYMACLSLDSLLFAWFTTRIDPNAWSEGLKRGQILVKRPICT